ncbi:MAG: hypothetical protein JW843_07110 [Candidatus Aminicenantes bacterium]|nr:hypothetical protein [Candidatus Aminicenantes bacterium]
MTAFIVIAVLSLAGAVFFRSKQRFQASSPKFRAGAYLKWIGSRIKGFFSASFFNRSVSLWDEWAKERYPGWLKWVFFAFAAAFLYLAASGLFYAVFIHRGMFGLPLLAHVMGGGVFALGLAFIMLFRARAYGFTAAETAPFEAFACPVFKNIPKALVVKTLFWTFAVLGFVQVVTALFSMLPVISFNTQAALIMIHRYSALGLVLTAIVFFDAAILGRPEPPRT